MGESIQGLNGEQQSVRAQEQVRQLARETGLRFRSSIIREFETKQAGFMYQREVLLRYRSMYGRLPPGNPVPW